MKSNSADILKTKKLVKFSSIRNLNYYRTVRLSVSGSRVNLCQLTDDMISLLTSTISVYNFAVPFNALMKFMDMSDLNKSKNLAYFY